MSAATARHARVWRLTLALMLTVPIFWAVHGYRFKTELDALSLHASQRLALLSASLNAELLRFESLPVVLAEHPQLRALLASPRDPALVDRTNRLLERVNDRSGAAMLYLIDRGGNTLAASNWQRPDSFVGENYAFRPYFNEALAGGTGLFFAVGATTRIPGFFIAHPVRDGQDVAGVIAVKIELAMLEQTWAAGGESVVVVDRHGVVALSSVDGWKFATLQPLDDESRRFLERTRQYYTEPLAALAFQWLDERRATLDGRDFLVASQPMAWIDWKMLMLFETGPARASAFATLLPVALVLCVAIVAGLYWRLRARRLSERLAAQAVLERTVAERTADLAETNAQLTREISERVHAEQALRGAQRDLIEANRLAALGQMAAGVAHELNQPLAALRTFAGNGLILLERNLLDPLKGNMEQMIGLVERMGRLTSQLKVFASRRQSVGGRTPANPAIEVVAGWFRDRLDKGRIGLAREGEDQCYPLNAQALEQVFSNLIGNALDALGENPDGLITIASGRDGDGIWLQVSDNGPGIDPSVRDRVMQPFVSTKPLGQGLGLGLAIVGELVEASGGRLEIRDGAGTVVWMHWAEVGSEPDGSRG